MWSVVDFHAGHILGRYLPGFMVEWSPHTPFLQLWTVPPPNSGKPGKLSGKPGKLAGKPGKGFPDSFPGIPGFPDIIRGTVHRCFFGMTTTKVFTQVLAWCGIVYALYIGNRLRVVNKSIFSCKVQVKRWRPARVNNKKMSITSECHSNGSCQSMKVFTT